MAVKKQIQNTQCAKWEIEQEIVLRGNNIFIITMGYCSCLFFLRQSFNHIGFDFHKNMMLRTPLAVCCQIVFSLAEKYMLVLRKVSFDSLVIMLQSCCWDNTVISKMSTSSLYFCQGFSDWCGHPTIAGLKHCADNSQSRWQFECIYEYSAVNLCWQPDIFEYKNPVWLAQALRIYNVYHRVLVCECSTFRLKMTSKQVLIVITLPGSKSLTRLIASTRVVCGKHRFYFFKLLNRIMRFVKIYRCYTPQMIKLVIASDAERNSYQKHQTRMKTLYVNFFPPSQINAANSGLLAWCNGATSALNWNTCQIPKQLKQ